MMLNLFDKPVPLKEEYVDLLIGNTDPLIDTAVVCAYLVVKGIATQEELGKIADKILVLQDGTSKLIDIWEMCKKVQKEMEETDDRNG